jgi:hypothetical protein
MTERILQAAKVGDKFVTNSGYTVTLLKIDLSGDCDLKYDFDNGYHYSVHGDAMSIPKHDWISKQESSWSIGTKVRKIKGSEWEGYIVGTYSTELTPEGYCVESSMHKGSVQIYPKSALEICS